MLSVTRLRRGGADYYLDSVARGAEDYYLGHGEAPGSWFGSGVEAISLAGEVEADDLRAVLAGTDPRDGEVMVAQRRDRRPGFDLCFKAPKSVSLLYGLGDVEIAGTVVAAHEEAVEAALRYLERHAGWSRRGRNGVEAVATGGFVAAAFRHRTSRAGDPQLHTHVLVANMVRRSDGEWGALDARPLYHLAKTAGYLYDAHLRAALSDELGVEWGPVRNGYADVLGIDKALRDHFSRRRREIEEFMAARGQTSARAADVAALVTRKAKDYQVDAHMLRAGWRTRAEEFGFDPTTLPELLHRVTEREPPSPAALRSVAAHLSSPAGLTEKTSTFTLHDAVRGFSEAFPQGATVSEVETWASDYLTRPELRHLPAACCKTRSPFHTTAEMLAIERAALGAVAERRDEGAGLVGEGTLAGVLARRPGLSAEQVEVVESLCRSGHGVEALIGRGGSGKTFTLDAAREAWQAEGRMVIGCAVAALPAAELEATSGIPSSTIALLLHDLEGECGGGLPRGSVLVVDEAATAGTRTLARLLRHAEPAGAKVVLVGDPKQLPEIDAGGMVRGIEARFGALHLRENRRQRHAWERAALAELRAGDVEAAIAAYDEHGRIVRGDTAMEAREAMVADWWAARLAGEKVVMIAARWSDVDDLNARARVRMQLAERLIGPELVVDERPYQTGDEVMCLKNAYRPGVLNGTRGRVARIDAENRTLTLDTDKAATVTLPSWYLDAGHVVHAYAATVHKAQGSTVDRAFVLGTDDLYREMGYTAMSRGRDANHLYVVGGEPLDPDDHHAAPAPPEPDEEVFAALERSRAKSLALDTMQNADPAVRLRALHAERRRLTSVVAAAPPDPTREREALMEARERASVEADRARETVASLGRHRRRPTPEQAWAAARLSLTESRVAEIDAALAALAGIQEEHDAYQAEHGRELARASAVESAITTTLRQRVDHVDAFRPAYLVAVIGEPSDSPEVRTAWRAAAALIENQRAALGVDDEGSVLGPEPPEGAERMRWRLASLDLEMACSLIETARGVERSRGPEAEQPVEVGLAMEL